MLAIRLGECIDNDANAAGCGIEEGRGMCVGRRHVNTDYIVLEFDVMENAIETLLDTYTGGTSVERDSLDLVLFVAGTQVDTDSTPVEGQVTHDGTRITT